MATNKTKKSNPKIVKSFDDFQYLSPTDIGTKRLEDAAALAKEFYETDVTPRAERERSNILYGIPGW
jgi:DNA replication protein DnaC